MALALCVAGALVGCGDNHDRDAVRAYIQKANAIQDQGTAGAAGANAAYARLSQGKAAGPVAASALQQTVADLRATRVRLAGLPAPAQAGALRRRLLTVFDRNIGLAQEAAQLATYVPAARRAMAGLSRAGARLRRGLASAAMPSAQTQVLGVYARTLSGLENTMRRLDPPPVLLDSHRSQLLRLDTARALAARLRAAIARRDGQTVAALLLRFRSVYQTTGLSGAVQRAAVGSYRRRVVAVNMAVAAIRREQQRLEQSLR
jgi:hypothetical protein